MRHATHKTLRHIRLSLGILIENTGSLVLTLLMTNRSFLKAEAAAAVAVAEATAAAVAATAAPRPEKGSYQNTSNKQRCRKKQPNRTALTAKNAHEVPCKRSLNVMGLVAGTVREWGVSIAQE